MSGVSFLPFSNHTYRQAPYQDCDEAGFKKALKTMPKDIDWAKLTKYELEDTTEGHRELACSAGSCEII
jgi:ribonucleoside-diphosphate reductase alpha chain